MIQRNGDKRDEEDEECPRKVASGTYADVLLFGEARRAYRDLEGLNDQDSVRAVRTLERYFERFAEHGPDTLTEKMYKPQGRHRDGAGNEHLLYEFKARQVRIYGVVRTHKGKRSFLGTACNPKKQKDKADPADLKRAAEGATRIEDD